MRGWRETKEPMNWQGTRLCIRKPKLTTTSVLRHYIIRQAPNPNGFAGRVEQTLCRSTDSTKVFFPDAIQAFKIIRKTELSPVLVQLMTGHGGFSSYLNRFKLKESPSCECNSETEGSVLHVLVECTRYGKNRLDV